MGDRASRCLEEHERRRLGRAALVAFGHGGTTGRAPQPCRSRPTGSRGGARRGKGRRCPWPGRSLLAGLELPNALNPRVALVTAAAAWAAAVASTLGVLGVALW